MKGTHLIRATSMALAISLFAPSFTYASQTYFRKAYRGSNIEFQYRWQNIRGQEESLAFALPQKALDAGTKEFKALDNSALNLHVLSELRKFIKANKRKDLELKASRAVNGDIKISAKGYDSRAAKRALEDMGALQEQAVSQYIRDGFYKEVKANVVMPDHARIAKRYQPAMLPVAKAFAGKIKNKTQRQRLNYILTFFQNIPYDTLQNRYTSNGAGFQTPYGLLNANRGDCDTKSVALASVIKNLYPDARVMVVFIPGHAFVGIDIGDRKAGDAALNIDGSTFVLAEPVGPGLFPFGKIADNSYNKLSARDYSYVEIH